MASKMQAIWVLSNWYLIEGLGKLAVMSSLRSGTMLYFMGEFKGFLLVIFPR